MTFPAIGDYALIGNCRTAALVSRAGSIEWLCAPTFSSPSLFAAVLDRDAGHFAVRPRGAFRVEGGAVLRLTDCMPLPAEPAGEIESAHELEPEHEILRRIECIEGEAEVEVEFAPRPDYARSTYEGEYRPLVLRSGLVLKLLNCATSGEALDGQRNWDYRYCWLRDSALVLHAFLALGFLEEAQEFLGWLLHATRLTWPELQIMYDLYGETHLKERTLPHLCGYRDSRPVRIGNAAHSQLQLDIYGELVAAVAQYVEAGGELDSTERAMLTGLAKSVCRLWRRPDPGIWETRSAPRHHTYSKAMCWVALDRLAKLRLVKNVDAIAHERDAIRADIEARGFSASRNSYVAYYGGEEPDASLLLLARHGYRAPEDSRMRGTYEWVRRTLSENGFVMRYRSQERYDGVAGGENAFAACSFWAAEYLANAGRHEEARRLFERLADCANDVGLYAEEIVPATGEPIGNFPRAFSHVSLISAAVALTVEKTA